MGADSPYMGNVMFITLTEFRKIQLFKNTAVAKDDQLLGGAA